MDTQLHALFIPIPAQGHVAPLMKLALRISDHGIKVTFVNTDFIHEKLMAALPEKAEARGRIRLVSIPDGLEAGDERRDILKLTESIERVMPGHLKSLIEKANSSNGEDEKITCVIPDIAHGKWPVEVAEEMRIDWVPFCSLGPGNLALAHHIPKLIEAGIINSTDGSPLNDELISVSKDIPLLSPNRLPWSWPRNLKVQQSLFRYFLSLAQNIDVSKKILCNSIYELDSYPCDLIPNVLPIGPLLASNNNLSPYSGNFLPEDSTCVSWLDQQPAGSVIYVAFGGLRFPNQQHQFNELAFGLELAGRPFLWVARSDGPAGAEYPDGFLERVAKRGKIVSWAPQEEVLAHPSVACFLSHCGWNSAMEGIATGVPFLCWPYISDQFLNQSYICEKWKVGLELKPDENGFISRHEIKEKIEKLVSDEGIKANAEKLKEMARKSESEGGSSYKNFKTFIEAMKT